MLHDVGVPVQVGTDDQLHVRFALHSVDEVYEAHDLGVPEQVYVAVSNEHPMLMQ